MAANGVITENGVIVLPDQRILLGHVDVDSGQLMIMDPCYVDREWISRQNPRFVGIRCAGHHAQDLAEALALDHPTCEVSSVTPWVYRVVDPNTPATDLQARAESIRQRHQWTVDIDLVAYDTYHHICDITQSDSHGGSLPHAHGGEGLAVAFESCVGDGTYAVFATVGEVSGFGSRIKKVEILLVED